MSHAHSATTLGANHAAATSNHMFYRNNLSVLEYETGEQNFRIDMLETDH